MGYSPRITFEEYVIAILQGDFAKLPPREHGCYSVWYVDFSGSEPTATDKDSFVIVGMTEGHLLERVSRCVVESLGITDRGVLPGNAHSYFSTTGRLVYLAYKNPDARRLLITWRNNCCPQCEEYKIYKMFVGGAKHLKQKRIDPCKVHP